MKRALALAAVAISAATAPAAHAQAVCQQRADIEQDDPGASLAVGDSVMLAAADQLAAYGFAVDAQACRRMDQGVEILRARELPSLVVVALGSNDTVSAAQVRAVLELVGPFGLAAFVLPRAVGGSPDPDGQVLRAAERAYPDQVAILDWPAYSAGRDSWFASDGLHLTAEGAGEFARFIAEAPELAPIPEEVDPPPEPEPPPRARPKPPPPGPDPLATAIWDMAGRALAAVLTPPVRLLAQLLRGGGGEPKDL